MQTELVKEKKIMARIE